MLAWPKRSYIERFSESRRISSASVTSLKRSAAPSCQVGGRDELSACCPGRRCDVVLGGVAWNAQHFVIVPTRRRCRHLSSQTRPPTSGRAALAPMFLYCSPALAHRTTRASPVPVPGGVRPSWSSVTDGMRRVGNAPNHVKLPVTIDYASRNSPSTVPSRPAPERRRPAAARPGRLGCTRAGPSSQSACSARPWPG